MLTKSSGTQTATLTTEHTLLDTPDAGSYALLADLNNLANGETVELLIYAKVLSGGTYRVGFRRAYTNAQDKPFSQSFPVMAPNGAKFTLRQTGGTGRAFPWNVVQLDA
jgi:hypothetical protein